MTCAAARVPAELDRLAEGIEPALAEASLVAGITEAARADWRGAAWLLEHLWPERWAPRHDLAPPDELG